jgi:hypothetical protein
VSRASNLSLLRGKTVLRVVTVRIPANRGASRPGAVHLERLEFTDGTALSFSVVELENDYAVVTRHGKVAS